jgi:hypothetical protein
VIAAAAQRQLLVVMAGELGKVLAMGPAAARSRTGRSARARPHHRVEVGEPLDASTRRFDGRGLMGAR